MAGLAHVKDVFAQEVEDTASYGEAQAAAPQNSSCAKLLVAKGADTSADAGANASGQHKGSRDCEVDQHAKPDERRGLAHQTQRGRGEEIGH